MKKSILTIGLFSLVMVLTSLLHQKLMVLLAEMLGGNMKMDIIGGTLQAET
jgi:hypothetical protein